MENSLLIRIQMGNSLKKNIYAIHKFLTIMQAREANGKFLKKKKKKKKRLSFLRKYPGLIG